GAAAVAVPLELDLGAAVLAQPIEVAGERVTGGAVELVAVVGEMDVLQDAVLLGRQPPLLALEARAARSETLLAQARAARAAPARRPGETIALRRPGGRRVVAPRRRDAREPAAVEAHDVDLRRARPRRTEGEAPPVGRPRRRHVDGPVIGEPLEELPAAVEEVDVGVAALLARHEELRAVG